MALSGEKAYERFILRPRVGVDLAYAKASSAKVTARQLSASDTGSVDIPSYQGVRGFAELVFAFGDDQAEQSQYAPLVSYEFAPRVLCQNALDGVGHECGFGGYVDYLWASQEEGLRFGLKLDYEHVEKTDALWLELRRERDILGCAGQVVTSVSTASNGDPQIGQTVQINF